MWSLCEYAANKATLFVLGKYVPLSLCVLPCLIDFRKVKSGWIRMGMPLLCSYKSTENGAILGGLCWCDYAQFTSGSIKTYVPRSVQISNRKMPLWNCLILRINLIITKIIHYPLLRNNLSCRPRRTYCCFANNETAAGRWSGAPDVNFRKISARKTIWDLEFSELLL